MPASIRIQGSPCQAQEAEEQRVLFLFVCFFPRVTEKILLWCCLPQSVQTQVLQHHPKFLLDTGKIFQTKEEKRLELQLLLRRLHIHSQPGFFQKKGGGNFCKKKAFFDSGMATTTIVENLCGITNCLFLKKRGSIEVSCLCLACHCVPFQEFHVLCLLEIGGKGAGGGGSIQSRQSKWAVTVQH